MDRSEEGGRGQDVSDGPEIDYVSVGVRPEGYILALDM